MKANFPGGVWPVMLTPFTKDNEVDEAALRDLVEWYIKSGVNGLFAVCQSSEMFYLRLDERLRVARIVKEAAAGRVPVIASGHISDSFADQAEELRQMAQAGVDAVILITNRLAKETEGDDVFLDNLNRLIGQLPPELPLGFYECPYPYKRVLSPEVIGTCARTGRFFFHKDTCCDITQIEAKLLAVEGTRLKLYNANTATLLPSLRAGAVGYSGVMANFHPELYVWLCGNTGSDKAQEVADMLSMCALIERQLYPVNAKYAMRLLGLAVETVCRARDNAEFTPTFAEEVTALLRMTQRMKESL